MLYKPFPLVPSQQPSWQIQLICQLMNYYGIKYDRERMFKGLTTIENRPLRVDVAFQNPISGTSLSITVHTITSNEVAVQRDFKIS